MRRLGRLAVVAVIVAALLVWVRLPAPPLTVSLSESESLRRRSEWRGAYHVHSNRSDGTGTIDEIARAAADAGLDFVIVTDHGDGTRTPERASYRSAVLVIDAVEISTTEGHYVALGLDRPAPYRLGGPGATVVDDVRWLGGFGIAAHPDSPRRSLSWRDRESLVDGLEWFNADSAWRKEPWGRLGLHLLTYPVRPGATMASMFDRPIDALGWWDAAAAAGRHRVALAALDAHARLGMRGTDDEEGRGGLAIEAPSYREMFGVATNRVWLGEVPTGDAERDAALVLAAIRRGHAYSVIEPFARPGFLRTDLRAGGRPVRFGDRVTDGVRLEGRIEVDGPPGAEIRLLHNGLVAARSAAPVMTVAEAMTPGSYRVEVHVPSSRDRREGMPWMVTNAVFVESPVASPAGAPQAAEAVEAVEIDLASCRTEADVDSTAEWRAIDGGGRELRYALARSLAPFAAVACSLPVPAADIGGIRVSGHAAPVMRVLVQIRVPASDRDLRWGSSVRFEGGAASTLVDRVALAPVSREAASASPSGADTLLLVIDRRHAFSGAQGAVRLDGVSVIRAPRR